MKYNQDTIIIKDNFLKKTLFQKIKKELTTLTFVNRSVTIEDNNAYQKIYFNHILTPEHYAVKEVKKYIEKIHAIKIIKMRSFYFLSPPNKTPSPHCDKDNINFLIYLKGNELINNGTGFYEKKNEIDSFELNTHIGFKENRAVMFSGNRLHSTLQFNDNCSGRYIMTNFIKKWEVL